MFGLFSGTRIAKSKSRPRARLSVEELENRLCLSPILPPPPPPPPPIDAMTLTAQVLPGHQVELSGNVAGGADATITFSGAVSASTTADGNGNFDFTTSSAQLGTVSAVATDSQEDTLASGSAIVAVGPPAVALELTYVSPQVVTLFGSVGDIDQAGLPVNFTGLVGGSTVTDANGNFSYTTSVSGPGAIYATATDLWGQSSNTAEADVAAPPTVSLNAQVLPGHEVQLTGTVSGANPAGATVTFTGAVSGSTTTDAYGNYTFTTTAASLGTVSAVAVDTQQNTSAPATATVADTAPTITLAVTGVSANYLTYAGKVTDVDQAGETVNISGATNGTVTTDANGNFSFTLSTASLGTIDVNTTDQWGLASNTAEVAANTLPPVVTNFSVQAGPGNQWILQGTVVAPNPQSCTVNFGGMQVLNGQNTTVSANGSFYIIVTIDPNDYGTASAQAVDQNGQTSNIATAVVN